MTTFDHARVALEKHLSTLSGLPPVAWPNVNFVPTPGTTWLRANFVPVTRRIIEPGAGGDQRLTGLYVIDVCTPERQGAAGGMTLADALLAHFPSGGSVSTSAAVIRIEYSEVKMPLHEPPFYVIPVEIRWYAFASAS